MEQANDSLFEPYFLELRNQEYFRGKVRYIPAYWDAIRMSIISSPFAFLCIMDIILPVSARLALLDWVMNITNPSRAGSIWVVVTVPSWRGFLSAMIFGFLTLVLIGAPFYWVYQALRIRRLSRRGQIVRGQLTEIDGRDVWRPLWTHYLITVKYRFLSPSGLELTGKSSARREDLVWRGPVGFSEFRFSSSLPKPGTPGAILYLDAHNYRLL